MVLCCWRVSKKSLISLFFSKNGWKNYAVPKTSLYDILYLDLWVQSYFLNMLTDSAQISLRYLSFKFHLPGSIVTKWQQESQCPGNVLVPEMYKNMNLVYEKYNILVNPTICPS